MLDAEVWNVRIDVILRSPPFCAFQTLIFLDHSAENYAPCLVVTFLFWPLCTWIDPVTRLGNVTDPHGSSYQPCNIDDNISLYIPCLYLNEKYSAESLHITLCYCTTDQVWVLSIFVGVMPLLELRILEIHSFPHFFPTCFDILSWNFSYDYVLLDYRSSASVVTLRPFGCPSVNLFTAFSSYKHWQI